jgi:anti-sigma-K factor RskA
MTEDRFEELLGPYVLGELTTEEERELERYLEEHDSRRDELELIRQTHLLLRDVAASGPRPDLKAQVLARATGATPAPRAALGRRKLWIPAAAALLVVAILGGGTMWAVLGNSSAGLPLTATALAPEASGEVQGERIGDNLRIELEVRGLPELPEDEYYEMWYASEDGGRISCGAFRPEPEGRQTTVAFTTPINARAYPEIEITREADDGDPASSGEKVLEGRLRNA